MGIQIVLIPFHPDRLRIYSQAASSPELFRADLNKGFIVGGLSAGAHLATVLAHRARDDAFFRDKRLTGQVIQIPPLLNPYAMPEKYAQLYSDVKD